MSAYVDRTGQRVGPWVVIEDAGRTKAGKVLWRCRHDDGHKKHLRTETLVRLARATGTPRPGVERFAIYRGGRLTVTEVTR